MKKNVVRLLFALVALLTSANMLAENKLWVQQYSANEDGTYEFAVMMENEPNVAALQFDLLLPPNVEIVKNYNLDKQYQSVRPNPERLNVSQKFMCSYRGENEDKYQDYQCAVFAMRDDSFIGTSGPLAFFTLRAKGDVLPDMVFSKPLDIKIEEIIMTTFEGTQVTCPGEWSGAVTVLPQTVLSTSLSELVVNPGTTFSLPIELTNSSKVQGLQFTLKLPEGFTLGNKFTMNPERVSDQSDVSVYPGKNANEYTLMLFNLTGAYAVRNTGSGLLFTCEITAPATMGEDLTIEVSDVVASSDDATFPGEGFTLSVMDGSQAYAAANAEIAALQSALDAAIAEIAKDCPDVKDNFKGEAIQAAIDALQQAVDAAYVDGTLPGNYESLMAPVETIKADIAKLVVDAKAAQEVAEKEAAEKAEAERKANNLAAYNADLAAIDALNASYRRIVAAIQAEFPEYESVSEELTVRNALDDAKAEVEKAYKAVADAGEYDYKLDTEGLEAMINKLYDDAKERAANAELTRQQENEGAYNLQMAAIEAVRGEAETALALIKEEYNNYDPTDDMIAILAALDKAEADAKAELEAVKDAGNYSYVFDAAAVRAMIDEMLKRAEAAGAVEGIEAEVEAGNVVIFTLDGKRHANPVHGEVNIFVRKNGKTSKVMVD